MDNYQVLLKPFDIQTHKATFTRYLEVIIDETGTVHYAVPSHQEWLIKKACEIRHCSREELNNQVPPEYYCDFVNWLCQITGCISVWNDFYEGTPNEAQRSKLDELEENGLFTPERRWTHE